MPADELAADRLVEFIDNPKASALEARGAYAQGRRALPRAERPLPNDCLDHGRGPQRRGYPAHHRDRSAFERRCKGALRTAVVMCYNLPRQSPLMARGRGLWWRSNSGRAPLRDPNQASTRDATV